MQNNCMACGSPIGGDDIGATKKLINRGSKEFFCVKCLAAKYGVSEDTLRQKIEFWRESGCLLFAENNKNSN